MKASSRYFSTRSRASSVVRPMSMELGAARGPRGHVGLSRTAAPRTRRRRRPRAARRSAGRRGTRTVTAPAPHRGRLAVDARRARPRSPRCAADDGHAGSAAARRRPGPASGAPASGARAVSRRRRRLSSSARRESLAALETRPTRRSRARRMSSTSAPASALARSTSSRARACAPASARPGPRPGVPPSRVSRRSMAQGALGLGAVARVEARDELLQRAACVGAVALRARDERRRAGRAARRWRARSSGPAGRSTGGTSARAARCRTPPRRCARAGWVEANALERLEVRGGHAQGAALAPAPRGSAWASAAPSSGSVPAPSSSSEHERAIVGPAEHLADLLHERGEGGEVLGHALVVARRWRRAPRNSGRREPSGAGTWQPTWAISASSASVLSAIVLPPALGPVIDEQRPLGVESSRSTGTTRAARDRARPGRAAADGARRRSGHASARASIAGAVASMRSARVGAREDQSSSPSPSTSVVEVVGRAARTASVSSARMRTISCSSSRVRPGPARCWPRPAASGSTKSVWPLCERSCTMPRTPLARLGPHRQHVAAVAHRDEAVGEEPVAPRPGAALEVGDDPPAPVADLAPELAEPGLASSVRLPSSSRARRRRSRRSVRRGSRR